MREAPATWRLRQPRASDELKRMKLLDLQSANDQIGDGGKASAKDEPLPVGTARRSRGGRLRGGGGERVWRRIGCGRGEFTYPRSDLVPVCEQGQTR